jgi:hypothetical protein
VTKNVEMIKSGLELSAVRYEVVTISVALQERSALDISRSSSQIDEAHWSVHGLRYFRRPTDRFHFAPAHFFNIDDIIVVDFYVVELVADPFYHSVVHTVLHLQIRVFQGIDGALDFRLFRQGLFDFVRVYVVQTGQALPAYCSFPDRRLRSEETETLTETARCGYCHVLGSVFSLLVFFYGRGVVVARHFGT